MKTFLMKTAAVAVVLAATNLATAGGSGGGGGGKGGHPGGGSSHMGGSMHGSHYGYGGRDFGHGYRYSRENFHWNYRCYSSRYGCDVYWCPNDSCYYYWCQSACCYYPVTYITYAPPSRDDASGDDDHASSDAGPDVHVASAVAQTPGPPAGPQGMTQRPDGVPAAARQRCRVEICDERAVG